MMANVEKRNIHNYLAMSHDTQIVLKLMIFLIVESNIAKPLDIPV